MKNGYRLSTSKGGRRAEYGFGNALTLYKKAQKTWKEYRSAWRGQKTVSDRQWNKLVKDIQVYQKEVAAPPAKDRIKVLYAESVCVRSAGRFVHIHTLAIGCHIVGHHILQNTNIFGHICLYLGRLGHIRKIIDTVLHHHIWQYMKIVGHIWLYLAISGHNWP